MIKLNLELTEDQYQVIEETFANILIAHNKYLEQFEDGDKDNENYLVALATKEEIEIILEKIQDINYNSLDKYLN